MTEPAGLRVTHACKYRDAEGRCPMCGETTTTVATMQDALDAIQALADALDRTQANFVNAVNSRPVRDMCENLAENHAAALKGARLMPMPSTLMRSP